MAHPRSSITIEGRPVCGKLEIFTFQVNQIVLGRMNGVWRKAKVIKTEQQLVEPSTGMVHQGIWAQWFNADQTRTTKLFFPMVYQDLVPDTPQQRQKITNSGAKVIDTQVPADVANLMKVIIE